MEQCRYKYINLVPILKELAKDRYKLDEGSIIHLLEKVPTIEKNTQETILCTSYAEDLLRVFKDSLEIEQISLE